MRIQRQPAHPIGQGLVTDAKIDKPSARHLDRGQQGMSAQASRHLGRNLSRITPGQLGRSQGAIALIIGKIGTVGYTHPAKGLVQTQGHKHGRDGLAQGRS
jgi:hypothetical protein